jgi:hypothetical protein
MENDSLAVDVSVGVQDSPLFWLVADSEVQLALVSVLNVERIERRTDSHLYDRGFGRRFSASPRTSYQLRISTEPILVILSHSGKADILTVFASLLGIAMLLAEFVPC